MTWQDFDADKSFKKFEELINSGKYQEAFEILDDASSVAHIAKTIFESSQRLQELVQEYLEYARGELKKDLETTLSSLETNITDEGLQHAEQLLQSLGRDLINDRNEIELSKFEQRIQEYKITHRLGLEITQLETQLDNPKATPIIIEGQLEHYQILYEKILGATVNYPYSAQLQALKERATARIQDLISALHDVSPQNKEIHEDAKMVQTTNHEAIAFTHFYPSSITRKQVSPLHVYIHLLSAIEKVKGDFRKRKDFEAEELSATEASTETFPRGTVFTIVPHIKRARVTPERVDVKWQDAFEHVAFEIKGFEEKVESFSGDVQIYVGPIIVAQLPIIFRLNSTRSKKTSFKSSTMPRYKKIFVSYSRKDEAVVRAIDRIYEKYPEIETYIDYKFLQASDIWWSAIQQKIEDAEALQLFWSTTASESSNVADEWRYALSLPRPIVPVILEPKPPIPPELQHIHFEEFERFIERL
ncbi:MAG: toll/interleukin-1 receptor domain-containing protein [Anaerolineae bacterium]|nr:toll/interleukin-1 receptor domain-containing protein [Anaerolineae bacterium]